jgi:hypothetical protein
MIKHVGTHGIRSTIIQLASALVISVFLTWYGAIAATAAFTDVISFVSERGWAASLGPLCKQFGIGDSGTSCVFRQVSVQETVGRGDPLAFNVLESDRNDPRKILIFHLGPMVGEFFVMSREGRLLNAFVRRVGFGYESVPLDEMEDEFKKDSFYWLENFDRIRAGLPRRDGD